VVVAAVLGGSTRVTGSSGHGRVAQAAPVVVVGGVGLIVLGSFLTWSHSGSVDRSSYEVVQAAELLDVVHGAAAVALKVWYLVPILGAMILLTTLSGYRRVSAGLAVGLSLLTLVVAAVVIASPLRIGTGPGWSLTGALVVVAGLVLMCLQPRGER
jgi:hypothetical protein